MTKKNTMKKQKGFSLIELLVVVAILGILSSIGIITYSKFTYAAKINVTHKFHEQVKKYIIAETNKCDLGFEKIFEGDNGSHITCSDLNSNSGSAWDGFDIQLMRVFKDVPNAWGADPFKEALNVDWHPKPGYVNVRHRGSEVLMQTCLERTCKDNYKIREMVKINGI